MNSIRFLILLTFVLYEMQSAQGTIKHLKYLKSLLLSKHLPSTNEQPIVEGELYPTFVQCEPAEGDANADTPNEWNPQQKPVLIEIENVESEPNIYPGQYYGVLPGASLDMNQDNLDVSPGVDPVILNGGNPEIEQKPEIVEIKKGVVSLKDKIREKINLIKSKLKLIHPEPRPVMEIIDQDSSFLPEQDNNNNNNYFQYTTGKPITTVESISTGKPISTIESITMGKPISTIESITTGKPISTMEWITTGRPISTIESITTEKPFSTIASITTGNPFSTIASITTGKPMSTMESITTGKPFSTMESITTEKPFSTIESIISGKPVTSTESVFSTAARPVVVIKPILKPHLYAQVNFDKGSRIKPFPFALPAMPQTFSKVYYYYPPSYQPWLQGSNNCLPPLTREMCRRRLNAEYAPIPWATVAKPLTLENSRYVVATNTGYQGNSQNQAPVFNQQQQQQLQQQQATVANRFGNYYINIDQQQQLAAIGIDPTIVNNLAQRMPYIESADRPRQTKPLTLENTRYEVVPSGGGSQQTQRPSIDQFAVVNQYENAYGDLQQPALIDNGPTAQTEQQQPPATVSENAYDEQQATVANNYPTMIENGPPAAQTSYAPPAQGLPEAGIVVSTPGQPIAVYPDVVVAPSPPSPYPENDWARNVAADVPEQGIATGAGPLRGDIPVGSDELTASVRYEQEANVTMERRQTKRDEQPSSTAAAAAAVDKTGDKKPVPATETTAKVETPVFELIAEQ